MFTNVYCSSADRFLDAKFSTAEYLALVGFVVLTIWALWQGVYWTRSKFAVCRITRRSNVQIRNSVYDEYKTASLQFRGCLLCVVFGYVLCGFCIVKTNAKDGGFFDRLGDPKSASVLVENSKAESLVEEQIAQEEPKKKVSDESDASLDEARQIVERQAKEMKDGAEGGVLNQSDELVQNDSTDVLENEEENEFGYDRRGQIVWIPNLKSDQNDVVTVSGSDEPPQISSPVLTGPLEKRATRTPSRLRPSESNGTPVRNLQNETEVVPLRSKVRAIPAVQLDDAFFEAREDREAQRRLTECFTPENPLAPYPPEESQARLNVISVSHEEKVGDGTSPGLIDNIWSQDSNGVDKDDEKSILVRIDEEANRISSLVRACVLPIETTGARSVEVETGCGFLTQYKGKTYVVTNNHVVNHAPSCNSIKIFLPNNQKASPKKVYACDDFDLAALEVDSGELPKDGSVTLCRFGDSDSVRVANSVFAIGNPFGLEKSLSYGHVSSLRRCNRDLISTNQNLLPEYIQIDASINPGNSGGPLYDSRGEVVGIVTAIATASGKNEGVAFAIPINVALRVVKTTIDGGVWKRSKLGVTLEPVVRAELASTSLPYVFGAKIVEITPRSPAHNSGLKPGDVVLSFNGKQVENDVHLARLIALADASEQARVGVLRGANYFEVNVKLEQATETN